MIQDRARVSLWRELSDVEPGEWAYLTADGIDVAGPAPESLDPVVHIIANTEALSLHALNDMPVASPFRLSGGRSPSGLMAAGYTRWRFRWDGEKDEPEAEHHPTAERLGWGFGGIAFGIGLSALINPAQGGTLGGLCGMMVGAILASAVIIRETGFDD